MDVLIVSGLSGAGKSQVVVALEDIGYYCVDNVPPELIPTFAEMSVHSGGRIKQMALVVDIRSKEQLQSVPKEMDTLKERGITTRLLFLECDDAVLATRYRETRRSHPLCQGESTGLPEALHQERQYLVPLKERADFLIDTSLLKPVQLRDCVRSQFRGGADTLFRVTVTSFGFKYGASGDSDLVFDVRCLTNPYYEPALRPQTGLDAPVEDYIMQFEEAVTLYSKLTDLLDFLLPLYIKEGKSNLVVSFGCTGGKHRSVLFAKKVAEHLAEQGVLVTLLHRDIQRG